uniref:Uncharacterized protein n=1 Tax=Cucumis sativus TaxID=3659 RepID=A0A0A0LMF1_CUCSA
MSESTENQRTLQQDEFQRWRDDLTEIANSSGVVSTQTGQNHHHHRYYYFEKNERENSGKNKGHKLPDLQKKLLYLKLCRKRIFKDRQCGRKGLLIVLGDIDYIEQLENLVGERIQFGVGSRTIIRTRNRQLLTNKVAKEQLSTDVEALLHFSSQGFSVKHGAISVLSIIKCHIS